MHSISTFPAASRGPAPVEMANTRGQGLSPEAGLVALARPERRVDPVRGQLSRLLHRLIFAGSALTTQVNEQFGSRNRRQPPQAECGVRGFLSVTVGRKWACSLTEAFGYNLEPYAADQHMRRVGMT
jgi:hypothetical protein